MTRILWVALILITLSGGLPPGRVPTPFPTPQIPIPRPRPPPLTVTARWSGSNCAVVRWMQPATGEACVFQRGRLLGCLSVAAGPASVDIPPTPGDAAYAPQAGDVYVVRTAGAEGWDLLRGVVYLPTIRRKHGPGNAPQ